jgi:4-amino-4-deoxy-L-arabinose transferase-like glycosyltransferase
MAARTRILIALLLILLLGWTLRLHAIDARSLWADEGWTMLLSQGPGLGTITRTMAHDQHPPLFFILFRLWRSATGDTELATRYFSVLIGMLAIAGVYQLGRELFNPSVGVLAALMLALSDLHIDLSQEVRHYSLLATLIIWSSLFYVRWWFRPTRTNRIGYVLASIALLYTHYLGGYVLIAQLIHMLIMVRPRRRLLDGLFLFGAICLGFLPWLPVVIDQNSVRWTNPLYYQNSLPNSRETYHAVRTALFGHYYVLMALLATLGLFSLSRWTAPKRAAFKVPLSSSAGQGDSGGEARRFRGTAYLVIWIVFMVSLTVIINERRQFLTVRNFILIVPPLAVLIGRGLSNLPHATRWFVTGMVLVIGLTTVDARRDYPNWRAVVGNVTAYHLDHEPVLMDVWVGDFPARYYIDRQMGKDTPRVSLREWRDQYKSLFLPTLKAYLDQIDAFWLIYWGDAPMDEYGGLIADAGFQRTATLFVDHHGTRLYSYRYDKLTNTTLATFGDLFALRKFAAPATAAPGHTLNVTLWWTAEQPPPLDYSVSVFVLDAAGRLAAQHDGPPLEGASPTSTWQPGDLKYDIHPIPIPDSLPVGTYQLAVKVYWYGDNQPLPVHTTSEPGAPPTDYAVLQTITVP